MPIKNYIWDVVSDNVLIEKDDDGNTIASYEQEPSLYGEIISQRRNGQTSYYNFDGQDSTRELTDQNQNVTDMYTYDAFGVEVARTGTTMNPLKYKGAVGFNTNWVTEDLYVRSRTYGPKSGRWMTIDPLPYVEGTNGYLFLKANPVNLDDPSGKITVRRLLPTGPISPAPCGEAQRAVWGFSLSSNPTCDGWIIQQVQVTCHIGTCVPCNPLGDAGIPTDTFSYIEAWKVSINDTTRTVYSDTGVLRSAQGTCGYWEQVGTARFFCDRDLKPVPRWTRDPTMTRTFGGKCKLTPGSLWALETTASRPHWWWTSYQASEGIITRLMRLTWKCCPCPAVIDVLPVISP